LPCKTKYPLSSKLCFAFFILVINSFCIRGQTTTYRQFSNEFQFTHPVAKKLALELDLASAFSDTPTDRSRLSVFTQFSSSFFVHYYYSAKWRFTGISAFFNNKYVPEIGQREYPELRLSGEAVYFINKLRNITLTRTRFEFRYIQDVNGTFEEVFRLRQQLKFTKPLNSKSIRKGTYYAMASDEIFFKTKSQVTGNDFFDRNIFSLGIGHSFTDNFQFELQYINEFVPRSNENLNFQVFQVSLNFNNPFGYIKRIIVPNKEI